MPAGWGEEERFAAAMESGTTSVGDDGSDGLARELEIAALLRSAGPALSPAPAAKARAKQRLMAAFAEEHGAGHADDTGPIAVTTSVALADRPQGRHAEPTPLRARAGGRHAFPEAPADEPEVETDLGPSVRRLRRTRPERGGHRRAALLGAAAAAALVALAGTGTFASRDALPGDPMYGVKRVAESTGYALTFGEQAKARRHLEQAQRRLDEVEGLVTRDQADAGGRRPGGPDGAAARALDDAGVRQQRQRGFAPAALRARTRRRAGRRRPAVGHRAVRAAVGHAVDDPCTGQGRRVARAAQPVARRGGRAAEGGVRPGRRTVPDRCATASRRRATRRPGRRSCPTPRCPGPTESRSTTRGGGSRVVRRHGGRRHAVGGRRAVLVVRRLRRRVDRRPAPRRLGRLEWVGGSAGGDAGDSGGEVSLPVLPLPVKVPSVAPGLPGVKLG